MLGLDFISDIHLRRDIQKSSMEIVRYLSVEIGERSFAKYENLNRTKEFIEQKFREYNLVPHISEYLVDDKPVFNISAEIKGQKKPESIVLVGAHYDSVEGTPGADDNATGIAGLLEIARLMSGERFDRTLRLVAFTLEEPPFFSTELMGSMKYAATCKKKRDRIELMICLEMLGYACKTCDQRFPFEDMKMKYPEFGNYLAVVSYPSMSDYVHLWKEVFNKYAKSKIYDIVAPASMPGVHLSDHTSFIKNGFPAIMLTDTGFYRNFNYHTEDDSFDSINFRFLAENIMDVVKSLEEILDMERIKQK